MAIYHFSVNVIGRSSGRSAVGAAAYRSASCLHDNRSNCRRDHTRKRDVIYSEVILPEDAPAQFADREKLWNAVEAAEKRKDAQLLREVEFAIPRELSKVEGIRLAREFVQREFVDEGMIADLNVHWDMGPSGLAKPHAHVMLTMREVSECGFGAKMRDLNRRELLGEWRERWANHVNVRLAELDIDTRIDHRSLAAQGIKLEPESTIGTAAMRISARGLPSERVAHHREIARRNGARIIANPSIALDAITHNKATFTRRDLAMFIHRHSDNKDQFGQAMSAIRASPDLVRLGKDRHNEDRFTSRDMIETERRLQLASAMMVAQERHRVAASQRDAAVARAEQRGLVLSAEQRVAFEHVTDARGLSVVVGHAGTGKSAMLGVACTAWESDGYTVRGVALSGITAENLESSSGIASRTIAAQEHQWNQGRGLLTSRDVLVIDEAGMVGTRQLERVLSQAVKAGAKVVLVGDPQQLQAIEAGAAFRAIHERHGGVEIGEVRRQHVDWQREATCQFAAGETGRALHAYAERGMVHPAETRDAARRALIESWDRERATAVGQSRIILTHTNDEVYHLNELARRKLRDAGKLSDEVSVKTERGDRMFAVGDRIIFLRNDRGLDVRNGTLATVENVAPERMVARTDDGRSVAFNIPDYAHVDHGYAATIHKAQGMTVDRTYVLATSGMDSHSTYVALSRHRDTAQLHYGRDDFADMSRVVRALSRDRTKDMAADYEQADPAKAFAERRGITVRERVARIIRKVPEQVRGIFANFRPTQRALEVAAVIPQQANPDLRRAVERYARHIIEIRDTREAGLPILPHQRIALTQARGALNAIGPEAARDLSLAFERHPELIYDTAQGRSTATLRAMQLEAEIRTNPYLRADQFVEGWQRLQRQHREQLRNDNMPAAQKTARSMYDMAKSLERDPQLESLLRRRSRDLGLNLEAVRKLSESLAASVPFHPARNRTLTR